MTGRSAGVALLLTLLLAARGEELVEVPATTQVVVDRAGVVDAASAARITALLLRLRQLTTAEVKVLVVRTTSPEDIVGFSQRIFTQWRLGRAGADNGALIVLAVDDHHVRIHSGYGLEAVLPDSWCGSLSRATVSEHFRAGLYSQGLERMVRAVAGEIAAAQQVDLGIGAAERHVPPHQSAPNGPGVWIFVIILVILLVIVRSRGAQSSGWGGSYGGFGGGGGGFGGGFGGGSGGGFSGGGGRSGGGGGGASW